MCERPLSVAWITFFPVEWLPDAPEALQRMPRRHPASWQRVLLDELKTVPNLKLHIFSVRRHFPQNWSFDRGNATFHCLKVPLGIRDVSFFWWETLLLKRALKSIRPDLLQAWGCERGAALVASRLGYPYLVTVQGLIQWYDEQVGLGFYGKLEAFLERLSLRRASTATVESRHGVKWLSEHYAHLDIRQAEHAPNWIFHRLERRPTSKPVHFLFVGVMSVIKGTDLLLQGLTDLVGELDFRLTIIGVGAPSFLKQLKATTSPTLWEKVTIRRNLMPEEVAEEVARATIMLFPTRADTSPNSVKEAVVAGLPVVASAIGGILDYVVPGRNGITYAAGNKQEFVKAVRAAVAHPLFGNGKVDPDTLQQMREYLSPSAMAQNFLSAYRHVAHQRASGEPQTSAATYSPVSQ